MSLEQVSKLEQAKKLIQEVIDELKLLDGKEDTIFRLRKAKGFLYIALKYWGE